MFSNGAIVVMGTVCFRFGIGQNSVTNWSEPTHNITKNIVRVTFVHHNPEENLYINNLNTTVKPQQMWYTILDKKSKKKIGWR